jgi:hypothetical protein
MIDIFTNPRIYIHKSHSHKIYIVNYSSLDSCCQTKAPHLSIGHKLLSFPHVYHHEPFDLIITPMITDHTTTLDIFLYPTQPPPTHKNYHTPLRTQSLLP